MDVPAIRKGLADALTNGGVGSPVHRYIPENVSPPCVVIGLESFDYGEAFGGAESATFSLTVVVSGAMQVEAQKALDAYMASSGAKSIFAAIEDDPTLGGTVDRALVTGGEAPGQVQFGDRSYPALSFGVTVIVS